MGIRILCVVFVALVALGCSDHFSVCTDIPISAAADAWGVFEDCRHPTIEVDRTPRGPAVSCMQDPGCNGRALQDGFFSYGGDDHWVYVKEGIDFPEITLAHEIGHLIGFQHTDDECDIMYPRASECRTERWRDR
jgi:hypothetical protein